MQKKVPRYLLIRRVTLKYPVMCWKFSNSLETKTLMKESQMWLYPIVVTQYCHAGKALGRGVGSQELLSLR